MNKLLGTLIFCLLTGTALAVDVERKVDAAADGHVEVSNISGEIAVEGWRRNEVEVSGKIGHNVEELIVERDGDKVLVKVKLPKRGGRGTDADLLIKVPAKSSVNVGTVSADIDVDGVTGRQSLHTVSGDVTTKFTGAFVDANSVSGDVTITGDRAEGEIDASTVSGDVQLSRVSGDIEAESVSGDVLVDGSNFVKASFNSTSGKLVVGGELQKGGELVLDTVNGDIDLELDGDVSASFNIDTFNGDIRNCFGPKARRASDHMPGVELEFTEGGGDGRVTISTLNGDISICKD